MRYDPEKHHRRSIRLKDYDYSQAGMYFITICVTDMECFFGSVKEEKMILNDAGKVIEKWYLTLPTKYPHIELGDYVVMPNHFHAIVINNGQGNPNAPYTKIPNDALAGTNPNDSLVGASPWVRPYEGWYLGSRRCPPMNIFAG